MIQVIHKLIAGVADRAGLPVDTLKIICCLLISYPLAGLLKRIPDKQPNLKNAFVISTGLFFLLGIFDLWGGIRTLAISSIGTYLLAKYYTSPLMPWANFFFIIGHMSIK